jgi:hypothetical protein
MRTVLSGGCIVAIPPTWPGLIKKSNFEGGRRRAAEFFSICLTEYRDHKGWIVTRNSSGY